MSLDHDKLASRGYTLEMRGVTKRFPGVVALENVQLSVAQGEVHALMGENGAGKSTLIKILTGLYHADEGEILLEGKRVSFHNTHQAQVAGIGFVYQELNMIPELSVSENIFIGHYPKNRMGVDRKRMDCEAQEFANALGIHIDVTKPLKSYSTAQQQLTAIMRAVRMNAKLVVMDEATSSLDTNEVTVLFDIIRKLKSNGTSVIFITHRLDEVYQICDRITILKDGHYEGTYNVGELTQYQLISKMVGREISIAEKYGRSYLSDETLLEVKNLKRFPAVQDVSFSVRKGEILGLAGLLGSGRTEVCRMIFGCDKPDDGDILIDGKPSHFRKPTDAVNAGFAFCTENRREEGVFGDLSVKSNIVISSLKRIMNGIFVSNAKKSVVSEQYVQKLRIKTPSTEQLMRNLSGGNQQKAILARWLATNPRLIILDEPTRGIDVGAKREVENLIREFAEQGISILLVSSELSELVRNCDRIIVLREGVVLQEIAAQDVTEDNIMQIIAQKAG